MLAPLDKQRSGRGHTPLAEPYSQADRATLTGFHLGAPGWAVAPKKRGPATAQKPWTPGEEYFRYGLDHLRRLLLLSGTAEEAFERCLRLLREPQRVLSGT